MACRVFRCFDMSRNGRTVTVFVLDKDKRSDKYATLSATGRDVEFQELRLLFRDGEWEFIESLSSDDFEETEVPACIQAVAGFMDLRQEDWTGTASELIGLLDCGTVRSSVLVRHLGSYRNYLLEHGVRCTRERAGIRKGPPSRIRRFANCRLGLRNAQAGFAAHAGDRPAPLS